MIDLKEQSDEFNKICRESMTEIVKDIRSKQVPVFLFFVIFQGIEYSELAYSQYFNDRIQETLKKAHIKLIEGDYYNFLYFVLTKYCLMIRLLKNSYLSKNTHL